MDETTDNSIEPDNEYKRQCDICSQMTPNECLFNSWQGDCMCYNCFIHKTEAWILPNRKIIDSVEEVLKEMNSAPYKSIIAIPSIEEYFKDQRELDDFDKENGNKRDKSDNILTVLISPDGREHQKECDSCCSRTTNCNICKRHYSSVVKVVMNVTNEEMDTYEDVLADILALYQIDYNMCSNAK